MDDLFAEYAPCPRRNQTLADGVQLLHAFALDQADELLAAIERIVQTAPWRQMETPGGYRMSVAMSNCGALGWSTDRRGYRYTARDPISNLPWPAMPRAFFELARQAAADAGFADFTPDACLINRYAPGAKLSLHQDKDEADFSAPIVSVSLGLPATFLLGGLQRQAPRARWLLNHGDVLVWGGPARLRYHAVLPLKAGQHPTAGDCRINLTLRKAA